MKKRRIWQIVFNIIMVDAPATKHQHLCTAQYVGDEKWPPNAERIAQKIADGYFAVPNRTLTVEVHELKQLGYIWV